VDMEESLMSSKSDTGSVTSRSSTRHTQSESRPDDTVFETDSEDVTGLIEVRNFLLRVH
jgi:hypothetical protein